MRRRLASLTAPALAPVLAAAMLTGCGSSSSSSNGLASKTPSAILAAARSAATDAATVRVAGSIVSEGEPISLDMDLFSDKGGQGRLTLGGLGLQLIDVDGAVYVKGSPAFYSRFAGPTAARLLDGRWLKGSAARGTLASLASLANLRRLTEIALDARGPLSRAAATTVDGQRALGVTDVATGATLYVAATGTPYPIEMVEGAGRGEIHFEGWNKPVVLAAPTNAINVKQLQSGR